MEIVQDLLVYVLQTHMEDSTLPGATLHLLKQKRAETIGEYCLISLASFPSNILKEMKDCNPKG